MDQGLELRRAPMSFWGSLGRFLVEQKRIICADRMGVAGAVVLLAFLVLAVVGTAIAPYGTFQVFEDANGFIPEYRGPSWRHPFGLTQYGEDVLSQVLAGTRIAVVVGLISAFMVVFVGANVGLISGYTAAGWTSCSCG